jgi:hypothetical protein
MLARLVVFSIVSTGCLTIIGFLALTEFLWTFGLQGELNNLQPYTLIWYGLEALAANTHLWAYVSALILLALGIYAIECTDRQPCFLVLCPARHRRSFAYYLWDLFCLSGLPLLRPFLPILQIGVLAALVDSTLFNGGPFAATLISQTLAGQVPGTVEGVTISQFAKIDLEQGEKLPVQLQRANSARRLAVVWETPERIVMTATQPHSRSPQLLFSIPSREIAGLEITRTIVDRRRQQGKRTPGPSIVFGILFTFLVAAAAAILVFTFHQDFRRRRGLSASIETADAATLLELPLPPVYARAIALRLCQGRDLLIQIDDASTPRTLFFRANATGHGGRIRGSQIEAESPASVLMRRVRESMTRDRGKTGPR